MERETPSPLEAAMNSISAAGWQMAACLRVHLPYGTDESKALLADLEKLIHKANDLVQREF